MQSNAYTYPSPQEFKEHLEDCAQSECKRDRIKAIFNNKPPYGLEKLKVKDAASPFVWITHKGAAYYPLEMATEHLFFAIRMLFNNTVPPLFRIGEFKRYRDIPTWSADYKKLAMSELIKELLRRNLAAFPDFRDQFNDMVENAVVFETLFKTPAPLIIPTNHPRQAGDKAYAGKLARRRVTVPVAKVRGYTRANGNKVRGYTR